MTQARVAIRGALWRSIWQTYSQLHTPTQRRTRDFHSEQRTSTTATTPVNMEEQTAPLEGAEEEKH